MDIFEQLNMLLVELEEKSKPKVKESDIPIHPDMETKEQGEMAAAEKILKLFQKLKAGSDSTEMVKDSRPEIPDDMIDPMMKETPASIKDKTFEKNKLAGWDERSEEKVEKEVDVDDRKSDVEDNFDDFDYHKNSFGDEEDDEMSNTDTDDRTEEEKLRDSIDDAIDSLSDDDDRGASGASGASGDDDDDDDSGADWGDDDEEGGTPGGTGEDGSEREGGTPGKNGEDGSERKGGTPGGMHGQGGKRETMSQKQKRLEELKKSLESDDMKEFSDKVDDIKNMTDTPESESMPGGQIDKPSDETFKDEMKKAGFDDESIEKMTHEKNVDGSEDYSEKEMDKLRKQVVDGLENACKRKGGSALASTIVKNAMKKKIDDDEWDNMLEIFLNAKSIAKGSMSSRDNSGIGWGHKNHLWRKAVLPKSVPGKGTIQSIYCFVDFSGSVERDLVFTFLGKVINLCIELNYTEIYVYGFGERLTEPIILNEDSLEVGEKVALDNMWVKIAKQTPGSATENFSAVTKEINKIKDEESDAVFLIFGDGLWQDRTVGPQCLKYEIISKDYLDDICVLTYYTSESNWYYPIYLGTLNVLKELVGIKHIIKSKASSIHE